MAEINQIQLDGELYQLAPYKETPQANSNTYGLVKLSDSIDSTKTAAGGWALSPKGVPQATASTYGVSKLSDTFDSTKTAAGGWALSPDVLANSGLGKYVTGTGDTASSIPNGGDGLVGHMNIPEAGIWIITCSGWVPDGMTNSYISVTEGGATAVNYFLFNTANVARLTKATKIEVRAHNWSGKTLTNVSVGDLKLRAVKVGIV